MALVHTCTKKSCVVHFKQGAISSAAEHLVYTERVDGSIPSSPTKYYDKNKHKFGENVVKTTSKSPLKIRNKTSFIPFYNQSSDIQ